MSSVPPKLGILDRSLFSEGAEERVQGGSRMRSTGEEQGAGLEPQGNTNTFWGIQILCLSKQKSAMFPLGKPG